MSAAGSTPQTVKFRGVDDLTLIADEWNRGDPARPSILLLHGGGQNRFSWKKTGQVLADEGLHVVALDSRGHGDSDRSPDADYSVDTLCADTLKVLDQIGHPVVLIGASMGGLTGILVADAAGPEKVTRLVLVDVVPRFEKNGSARIRDFMFNHVHGFDSLDEAADAVAAYLPHRTKPRSPEGLKKNLRHRDGRWYWHWDPAFLTKPEDDPFIRVEKLEQAAINLTIPILLIRGKLSDVVSIDGVKDFLSKVPGAEFVELSDAGHTAAGDDNDAFSEVVVQFVEPMNANRRTVGFNFLEEPELPAPQVTESQAEEILATHYGVRAHAKSLGSQQDKNFLVDGGHGEILGVLKIANPAFNETELEAQDQATELIAEAEPSLRVAVPLPNLAGEKYTRITGLLSGTAFVRLLRFLPGGTLLESGYLSPSAVAGLGDVAGRVSRALADFSHPGLDRVLQWDLRYGHDVVSKLAAHVADASHRDRLRDIARESWSTIAPLADDLPQQAMHLDLTDANVVVSRSADGTARPDGIIDFGDLTQSWSVSELAITASCVLGHSGADPTSVLPAIRAFHEIRPLNATEVAALWPMLVLRCAVLIVSGAQQAAIDPDNDYITAQADGEWRMFETAASVPMDVMTELIRAELGMGVTPPALDVATPLVAGLDPASVVTLDLSPTSDVFDSAFRVGGWLDPGVEDELARAATENGARLVVTRFGQPRLSRTPPLSQHSPDVVATGIGLWPSSAIDLVAPAGGEVMEASAAEVTFRARDYELTLSGVQSVPAPGSRLDAGDALARAMPGRWVALGVRPVGAPRAPLLTRAELAPGWLALARDPRALLGLPALGCGWAGTGSAVAPRRELRAGAGALLRQAAADRARLAAFPDVNHRPVLPRHGQQRHRAGACTSANRRHRIAAAAQAQHQLTVQLPGGGRVQRTPGRHPARSAGHGVSGELRFGSKRSGDSAGVGGDGAARRGRGA